MRVVTPKGCDPSVKKAIQLLSSKLDYDASPTFAGLTVTNACVLSSDSVVFQPNSDSTTFFQILDANGGTSIFNIDSINERVGFGTDTPLRKLDVYGGAFSVGGLNDGLFLSYGGSGGVIVGIDHAQNGYNDVVIRAGADGTGIVIKTDGSTRISDGGATNYTEIESDGTIEFHGTATIWNDANLGVAQLVLPVAGQPDEDEFVDEAGDDTGISTWAFAVGEKVSGSIEIPHDYKEGSDITFHIHWQGIAAPSGTDNVKWQCTYTVAQQGTTLDAPITIVIETAFDTQYEFMRSSCPAITGTNFNMGDQFLFTLERIGATGDAYTGDALVATVGIHYECDTCGSRQILTK